MYLLAKEVFAEELGRWARIEEKAGRFLTVIGLMFALLTWVGQSTVIPPHSWTEWALSLVAILLFFTLGGGGWFCFQTLRLGKLAKISIDKATFMNQPLAAAYEGYANTILKELRNNREACDQKTHRLERAYSCLTAAFVLALVGGLLITIHLWQRPT